MAGIACVMSPMSVEPPVPTGDGPGSGTSRPVARGLRAYASMSDGSWHRSRWSGWMRRTSIVVPVAGAAVVIARRVGRGQRRAERALAPEAAVATAG
ncbi:hypothetical protein ACFCWG_03320 [Streptomyces sp. NPDC056390]|uniref:hypothetical protein n=1 Tax=Streptomyces sp. NPDC056390 TaxID=3345806 RepID=UPI0035D8FDB1